MSDVEKFLMFAIWLMVIVTLIMLASTTYCSYSEDKDEHKKKRLQILMCFVLQLVAAILACVFTFTLLPMTLANVVLLAIASAIIIKEKPLKMENLSERFNNWRQKKDRKKLRRWIWWILGLSALFGLLYLGFWVVNQSKVKVDPGERAIKRSWGKIVPESYGPGLVWFIPFSQDWGNEVIKVPTRPQRYSYNVPVRTKELQKVSLDCSVLLQLTPDSIHVLYDKYTGYEAYEQKVVRDMVQQTMLTLSSQMSFWSFAEETNKMMADAVEYIVNDQLMAQNLVKVEAFRLKGYQASPEVEALIEKTVQAHKNIELEQLKLEMAKIETEKVKQEAIQTYERLAAVAKANGIDVQIKAEALKNPFVAQYEVAKALQKWNGDLTLPNTLMTMSSAAGGNGISPSVLPIMPITTK